MNLQLQKDSSFNRSFERENGLSFCFLGQNKFAPDFSLNRGNSINKSGSINLGYNPYRKDGKQPINLFVELADDTNNEKNEDYLNLNVFSGPQHNKLSMLQRNSSCMRPMMFKDQSCTSNLSLNVNTGNEMIHNPTPIKLTKKESTTKAPEEVPVQNEERTNDKTNNHGDTPGSNPTKDGDVDSGDMWVKSQEKEFSKSNYNWNQEVEGLLDDSDEDLTPTPVEKPKKRAAKTNPPANVNIRRHRKKTKKQLEVLDSHFSLEDEWSLDLVEKLAAELNLEKDQVYKWNWDKRKRLRKKAEREGKVVPCKKSKNKRQRTN